MFTSAALGVLYRPCNTLFNHFEAYVMTADAPNCAGDPGMGRRATAAGRGRGRRGPGGHGGDGNNC